MSASKKKNEQKKHFGFKLGWLGGLALLGSFIPGLGEAAQVKALKNKVSGNDRTAYIFLDVATKGVSFGKDKR